MYLYPQTVYSFYMIFNVMQIAPFDLLFGQHCISEVILTACSCCLFSHYCIVCRYINMPVYLSYCGRWLAIMNNEATSIIVHTAYYTYELLKICV